MDKSNPGDIPQQNFFDPNRNDIPQNNLQREAWQPALPGQIPARQPVEQTAINPQGGFVTIQDGNDTFYVPAGSRVIVRHNGDTQLDRVGAGPNSFIPNYGDTYNNINNRFNAQPGQWRQPYYPPENNYGYQPRYGNVNAGAYEVPIYPHRNPVASFFGALTGAFLGVEFGGRGRYGYGYGGGGGFYHPPFIPHRPGISIGVGIGPSWQAQNYNYYNTGYAQMANNYGSSGYDAYGNPIYG